MTHSLGLPRNKLRVLGNERVVALRTMWHLTFVAATSSLNVNSVDAHPNCKVNAVAARKSVWVIVLKRIAGRLWQLQRNTEAV